MENTYRNICEVIVPNDLCIGCGLCAGICPPQVLEMRFNQYGEYIPVEFKEGCLPKCDLCLRACPFFDQEDNEDSLASANFLAEPGIKHSVDAGFYLDTFVGYNPVDEQRLNSASGGLATIFLSSLLEKRIVDRVICVVPDDDPEKLFRFTSVRNPSDVSASAKSCYYPVEMSNAICEILNTDVRYAIMGLPCFLKAIRLAMQKNPRLRNRIVVLAGIVCGQTKSKFFAEYLCKLKGGDPALMNYARFRVKDLEKPANNFGFQFKCAGGNVNNGTIYWKEGMSEAWVRGYFKPNACNYCDDIFAEVADVVFMDAWLERYIKDPKGTNFVIVRKSSVLELLKTDAGEGKIFLENICIESVFQSQHPVIEFKRSLLSDRLAFRKFTERKYTPNKRVSPARLSIMRFFQIGLDYLIINTSKSAFLKERYRSNLRFFNMYFIPTLFIQRVIRRLKIIADSILEVTA